MKRRKRGFTLVETLIATAVLALFVSMTVVGTTAIFGTGEQMMAVSKAAVLGSDVMKIVTNEIRFGEEFAQSDGTTVSYDSTTYGEGCTLTCDGSGQLIVVQTPRAVSGGEGAAAGSTFYPLGSAAYDEVHIKAIAFTIVPSEKNENRQSVSCTLTITSDGTNTLWEKSVTIVPLYQKTLPDPDPAA